MKKTLKEGNRQITILIVEDDQDLREVLATSLRNEGYQVISAQDSDEAIASVKIETHAIHHPRFLNLRNPGISYRLCR